MASRDEIMSSLDSDAPMTSSFTTSSNDRPPSPVMDDPSVELERELESAH